MLMLFVSILSLSGLAAQKIPFSAERLGELAQPRPSIMFRRNNRIAQAVTELWGHLDFYEKALVFFTFIFLGTILAERSYSKSRKSLKVEREGERENEDSRLEENLPGSETMINHEQNLSTTVQKDISVTANALASTLARQYLTVYALVMGADWLQGPYIYSLYREQYELPERLVAVLFVLGFLSAGFAAPLVGVWADRHGRRTLCLTFCFLYTLSCFFSVAPSFVELPLPVFPVLLLGRFLGGIATSILFSCFETWLVSSASSISLAPAALSSILGHASLVNGLVASVAGVVSARLVNSFHTFSAPFVGSTVLLVLSWIVIRGVWDENYGILEEGEISGYIRKDIFQLRRLRQAWNIVRKDSKLLVLGLMQTCVEGSMYLFVFAWVPSLQEVSKDPPPLGYVFSCFMISMMLGSLIYNALVTSSSSTRRITRDDPISLQNAKNASVALHAKLSSMVSLTSAIALMSSVILKDAKARFFSFCIFELCIGMYYPIQGMLRGALIADDHRATVSSLFRVPLNIFVVVSLLTGVSSARALVLITCSCLLIFSAMMITLTLVYNLTRHSFCRRPPIEI